MIVVLFYLFLFSLWAENVLGFSLTTIRGMSALTLSFYLLTLGWILQGSIRGKLIERDRLSLYLFILFFVFAYSIPLKRFLGELPSQPIFEELSALKYWLSPFLIFFILRNGLHTEKECRLVLISLIVFLLLTALTTISAYKGIVLFPKVKVEDWRVAGFVEQNQYAVMVSLFLPLLLLKSLFASGGKSRAFNLIILLTASVALILTGSRGGIISAFFGIVAALILLLRQRIGGVSAIAKIFVVVSIIVGVLLIYTPSSLKLAVGRLDPDSAYDMAEYTSGRTLLWKNGIKLFLESPIFGHGIDTFIPLMKKNFRVWGNSHNDYLLYLVNYGLIGLSIFLLVLFSIFKQSFHFLKYSRTIDDQVLLLSYIAGLSSYCVGMFGVNVIQPQFIFWAYTGAVLKYGAILLEKDRQAHTKTVNGKRLSGEKKLFL